MSRHSHSAAPGRARALLALVAVLLALGGILSTAAQEPNGAGLVIRHGDGTLIYAYVQFQEDSISGLDLLTRSGVDMTLAPFGGLGGAVCSLNSEGCPSDNCFCHSYSSPSYFWHYYVNEGDGWITYPVGPASRTLTDGDIDGWSWTSGENGLPEVNIDDIAAIAGFDRSPTAATATPDLLPPSTLEPTATNTPIPPSTATVTWTATAVPTAAAVIVTPGTTPVPLAPGQSSSDDGTPGYVMFLGMAGVVVTIGALAAIRNRSRST